MQGSPLTFDQKVKFIKKLKQTNGNVSKACQVISISRSAVYVHKKEDTAFSELWDETIEQVLDEAEQEVYRRAVKGTNKPVFYKGVKIAALKEYSDRLLEFMLKAGRPEKFRDRVDVNQKVSGSLDITLHDKIKKFYGKKDDDDGSGK